MVFTSPIFLFYYLPLALLGYYATPRRYRNVFLLVVSYAFYGWWNPWFVFLMALSTVIDWFCGIAVTDPEASEKKRKRAVAVSVTANLSLLGFFKYFMFAQENINRMFDLFGSDMTSTLLVTLPVGISFYSLQSMSYTIDLYRGHAKRAQNLLDFSCYVAMYPQLVAGPIVRYREIAEQLVERPQKGELFYEGALTFMIGFVKKVLLANFAGECADLVFAAGSMPWHVAWWGVLAYHFELYFDFSGYSDMAIGLGKMLGFELPINFRSPYHAHSVTEFWRRWHISLSSWLRDYLYIPLGGSRKGVRMTYRNLLITMVLGGLWHGSQWNYIVWGFYQGGLLSLERAFGKPEPGTGVVRVLKVARNWLIFMFSWVLFRSTDFRDAWKHFGAMFAGVGDVAAGAVTAGRAYQPFYVVTLALSFLIVVFGPRTVDFARKGLRNPLIAVFVYLSFLLAVVAMYSQAQNPFVYFQF